MKFAAILGAAAVLTAGAASAAEIGVRHTWGTSDRVITHGQSMYERTVNGSYSENSEGFALGVKANYFEVELEKDLDIDAGPQGWFGYGVDVDFDRSLEIDGKLSVAGSTFSRTEHGHIRETASESYNFGGSSSSGFSELSTFSR